MTVFCEEFPISLKHAYLLACSVGWSVGRPGYLVLLSSLINSHYEMHFRGKHPHNVMRHNSALSLLRYTRCKANAVSL